MTIDDSITHLTTILRADPTRVVIRPFLPAEDPLALGCSVGSRSQRIADRIQRLAPAELEEELLRVLASLSDRHRAVEDVLMRRYHEVNGALIAASCANDRQALLIGAYFCEEYSFEAAALFNPSIVPHPDQSNVRPGGLRFILSLRSVGEGHLSSITFRTGMYTPNAGLALDPASAQAISPRLEYIPGGAPDDPGVRLYCDGSRDLSEIVIFPITPKQRHGIEDLRMVKFISDDGIVTYLGTYTAFSGGEIRQELLRTTDFATFELLPLHGTGTANKGMALFPRRIDGRYVMLGRQDHENIWLLTSSDLYVWDIGAKIIEPRWTWEFAQIGNCGSPIEIEEGWLVIIHGVGAVRNYCIGICLLDKDDPSKLLARMTTPLLRPSPDERDGYVPNVIYSCGALVHERMLILPYGVADSFTAFTTIPLSEILAAMAPMPHPSAP